MPEIIKPKPKPIVKKPSPQLHGLPEWQLCNLGYIEKVKKKVDQKHPIGKKPSPIDMVNQKKKYDQELKSAGLFNADNKRIVKVKKKPVSIEVKPIEDIKSKKESK